MTYNTCPEYLIGIAENKNKIKHKLEKNDLGRWRQSLLKAEMGRFDFQITFEQHAESPCVALPADKN